MHTGGVSCEPQLFMPCEKCVMRSNIRFLIKRTGRCQLWKSLWPAPLPFTSGHHCAYQLHMILSLSLSHTHTHTHTHTHNTLRLSHTHSHTHTLTQALTLTHTYNTLCLSHTHSHTHTHTHTHSSTHTHKHTQHTPSLSSLGSPMCV